MADFLTAQQYVLANEGGYTPIDNDTYRGIARRFFPAWQGWAIVDAQKPLAQGQIIKSARLDSMVSDFYKANFWDKMMGDAINSQPIATYCYDWFVNAGANAIRDIQEVVGATVDGDFGNQTLAAVNNAGDILQALHDKRVAYYAAIGTGAKEKYLTGWENRANGLYDTLA